MYPLLTQKRADFELFKMAVKLINDGEHFTEEGLCKIVSIKASMGKGLSGKLKESFPSIIHALRPDVLIPENIDPNWLAGFVNGEGCFFVNAYKDKKSKMGLSVNLRFIISQHKRDHQLINSFVKHFGCGSVFGSSNKSVVEFLVTRFEDIVNKIIPFPGLHQVNGDKFKDYEDFCKVASLMQNKKHLTDTGVKEILLIKANMNRGRQK